MKAESRQNSMLSALRAIAVIALMLSIPMGLMIGCPGNTEPTETNDKDGGTNPENGGGNCTVGTQEGERNGKPNCVIQGEITTDTTLTPAANWILRGGVFVGGADAQTKKELADKTATLTIQAGTTVYGETGSTISFLTIRRGSKIMAVGTKDQPIIFTSAKDAGTRARGDWGGVIINGKAKINRGSEAEGEGGTGFYGGEDDADNSGELKYVRIEFAGRLLSPENELNGLALQGVGSGTKLSYIQIHMNKDDGIEFYGGTAQVKYLLVTGAADDSIDWTDGWRGKLQFAVVQQYDDAGDQGIEADNLGDKNDATPRSKPTISNVTLIGSPQSEKSDIGVLLREGTAGHLSNFIVVDFNDSCISLDQDATFTNASADGTTLTGELTFTNSYIKCAKNFKEKDGASFKVEDFINTMNAGNKLEDPMLTAPTDLANPDAWLPKSGSPVLTGAVTPDDAWFDKVDFIGGVGTDNWTKGWTISAKN